MIKKFIRAALRSVGYDIVRYKNSPGETLLGLATMPIMTIIDVGANDGQFARSMRDRFPGAQLYCYEPLPSAFMKLKACADKELSRRMHVFNVAIGDSEGMVDMRYHVEHSVSSSLLETTSYSEALYPFIKEQLTVRVRQTTLDKALGTFMTNLQSEILIKLDVQGYEDRVIRGGGEIFRKAKAVVLEVNLDALYQQQPSFREIVLMLDGLGYRYAGNVDQVYGDDGHVIYIDAVFLQSDGSARC